MPLSLLYLLLLLLLCWQLRLTSPNQGHTEQQEHVKTPKPYCVDSTLHRSGSSTSRW
jgi:hypothetical protein